jgi:hypothetical protein
MTSTFEDRLPDEGKRLLDDVDWIRGSLLFSMDTVLGEVKAREFLAEGRASALRVAAQFVGVLAEE